MISTYPTRPHTELHAVTCSAVAAGLATILGIQVDIAGLRPSSPVCSSVKASSKRMSNTESRRPDSRRLRPQQSSREQLGSRSTPSNPGSYLPYRPSSQQSGPVFGGPPSSRPLLPTALTYSSTLPQSQWQDVPVEYRPPGWREAPDQRAVNARRTPAPFTWRLRQPSPDTQRSPSSPPRRRRRPQALHDLPSRSPPKPNQLNPASLDYPELSPYESEHALSSAPADLSHARSVSQPNTPSWMARQYSPGEAHSLTLPRAPTFPPDAGRRRLHSASRIQDAAFEDEAEFRLFVEATAGLSPQDQRRLSTQWMDPLETHYQAQLEQQMAQTNLDERFVSPLEGDRGTYQTFAPVSAVSPIETREQFVSPVEQTPTTVQALQALAAMPQGTSPPRRHYQQQQHESQQVQHRHSPRPSPSLPTEASWYDLPDDPAMLPEDFERLEMSERFGDDELPDYTTSQAEAHARHRAEASRRAQELQRWWREAGRPRVDERW